MLHFSVWLLPFIVLLQNKHTTFAENVENLISTQPPISAHLKLAPTLKVQKFNNQLTVTNPSQHLMVNYKPFPLEILFHYSLTLPSI